MLKVDRHLTVCFARCPLLFSIFFHMHTGCTCAHTLTHTHTHLFFTALLSDPARKTSLGSSRHVTKHKNEYINQPGMMKLHVTDASTAIIVQVVTENFKAAVCLFCV
ncbi:hypothetical protein AMECASPLE_022217 [Ameca splendens]|uniref:Secreted protein n=1 Tax=Ameca splendens TaxID=208324 RepID=A0ABV0XST7_9TELE